MDFCLHLSFFHCNLLVILILMFDNEIFMVLCYLILKELSHDIGSGHA